MAYMIPPKQIYAKPNFQSALQHLAPHHIMHPFATTVTKKRGGFRFRRSVANSSSFAFQSKMVYLMCRQFPQFSQQHPTLELLRPLFTVSWEKFAPLYVDRNCRMAGVPKPKKENIGTTPRRKKSARVQEAKSTDSPAAADDVGPGGQRPAGLPGDGGGGLPRRHAGGG